MDSSGVSRFQVKPEHSQALYKLHALTDFNMMFVFAVSDIGCRRFMKSLQVCLVNELS
jgi:hypothetical protein